MFILGFISCLFAVGFIVVALMAAHIIREYLTEQ